MLAGAESNQAADTSQAMPSGWFVEDSTDPIDDSRIVTIGTLAVDGVNKYGDAPALYFRCKDKVTQVIIDWGEYIDSKSRVQVQVRLGNMPSKTTLWTGSTNQTALFYGGNGKEFLLDIASFDRFVARVRPYNSNDVTGVFDVSHLIPAMAPLREACGW